ncbi:unnamed protein product [Caenorhabditis auriculariae]|uniref:UPAR/Ly6 domain-containing protein n=1 Tax=Caenorhabditis auriculariae TaxID=2777116 RepID=A0A8S1HS57_9PELO|nr:unnamed protein product [Caenorhabditis auriculariae]
MLRIFLFLSIIHVSNALFCYNDTMQRIQCDPASLFCIKFTTGNVVTRGCSGVTLCYDEDPWCYPINRTGGIESQYCCCDQDMCNLSLYYQPISLLIFIVSIIFLGILQ